MGAYRGGGETVGFTVLPDQQFIPTGGQTSLSAPSLDVLVFQDFSTIETFTIDTVVIEVTTVGAAGSVFRAGLYTDANGVPENLITDFGTVDTAASIGAKTWNINERISAGRRYWLATVPQVAAATVRAFSSYPSNVGFYFNAPTFALSFKPAMASISGALPATANANTRLQIVPITMLHRAA